MSVCSQLKKCQADTELGYTGWAFWTAAISFCSVFLLFGTDPKLSYQHHKMKLCESICFQIGKINFFLLSIFAIDKNELWTGGTFSLKSIHPWWTYQPWWNSLILWGKKRKRENKPLRKQAFCQVLITSNLFSELTDNKFWEASELSELIQLVCFPFFSIWD